MEGTDDPQDLILRRLPTRVVRYKASSDSEEVEQASNLPP